MDIKRAALERVVKLGELYDARCDKFLNKSLLAIDLNENLVDSFDLDENDKKSVTIIESNKFTDKSECLDIDEELQTSIVSGCVDIRGVHEFLLDNHNNNNEMSLIYRINTIHEDLDLKSSKNNLNVTEENIKNATHVTVGIDYGALCIVTCHYTAEDRNLEGNEIKTKLITTLNSFKDELASGNQSDEIDDEFVFTVKCDLTQFDFGLNIGYKEALNFIREIVEEVNGGNIGKGKPQAYHLRSVSRVKQICKMDFDIHSEYKPLDKLIREECLNANETFHSIVKEFKTSKNEFSQTHVVCSSTVEDINKEFDKIASEFKQKLEDFIFTTRSGKETNQRVDSILNDLTNKSNHLKSSQLNKQGFKIIINNSKTIIQNGFVLYVQNLISCTEQNETFKIFHHLFQMHHGNQTFYIASLDDPAIEGRKEKIHFCKEGNIVWNDVVTMINRETNCCLVNLDPHSKSKVSTKKAIVKTMFDNKFFTEFVKHQPYWFCYKCRHFIEYGLDTKLLYCRCGESNPQSVKFLTNDLFLYSYDMTKLSTILNSLPQSREINILVLGETGVGKSTWINGIHNYFRYENLSEASESELVVPIPSKFKNDGRTISVGNYFDKNENLQTVGEVGTLGPKLYPMIYEDYKVNIIDTPGIGDPRGEEKDKENFNKVLDYLSNFDTLHAVCILLKPNSSRLTEWFTSCLDNLLTHLHSSIVKNIVFCFTHARSNFYNPGDTLPVLQKYLADKKISIKADHNKRCFVFDNESFRYLACLQNGDESVRECIDDFDKSWIKSRNETVKLLDYVCHLAPHELKKTISLHSVRQALLMLQYPLATIVDTLIPENIETAEKWQRKLTETKDIKCKLEEELKFEVKSFEVMELDHPRTVCTNKDCVTVEKFGVNDSETKEIYNVCHENCRIDGLQINSLNDRRISKCSVFQYYNAENLKKLLGEEKAEKFTKSSLKRLTFKCNNVNCKRKDKILRDDEGHYHECKFFDKLVGKFYAFHLLSREERNLLESEYRETCSKCGHSYNDHMHITYELKTIYTTFISDEDQKRILEKKTEAERIEAAIQEVNEKVDELREEKKEIYSIQAKFSVYIARNSLVPMADTFECFIKTFIRNEEASIRNSTKVDEIKSDLEYYQSVKQRAGNLTAEEIMSELDNLKSLTHIGRNIGIIVQKLDALKIKLYNKQCEAEEDGIDIAEFVAAPLILKRKKFSGLKNLKSSISVEFGKVKADVKHKFTSLQMYLKNETEQDTGMCQSFNSFHSYYSN